MRQIAYRRRLRKPFAERRLPVAIAWGRPFRFDAPTRMRIPVATQPAFRQSLDPQLVNYVGSGLN